MEPDRLISRIGELPALGPATVSGTASSDTPSSDIASLDFASNVVLNTVSGWNLGPEGHCSDRGSRRDRFPRETDAPELNAAARGAGPNRTNLNCQGTGRPKPEQGRQGWSQTGVVKLEEPERLHLAISSGLPAGRNSAWFRRQPLGCPTDFIV